MKHIATLCLLLSGLAVGAQKTLDGLQEQFTIYNQLIIDGDYETSLAYAPPALFDLIKREELLKVFESTMNSADYEIKTSLPKFTGQEIVFEEEGIQYQVFYYDNHMGMKFQDTNGDQTQEEIDATNELRLNLYKAVYASGIVTFDKQTGWFDLLLPKKALAIKYPDSKQLHFIVIEENQRTLLEKLFSYNVLKIINP